MMNVFISAIESRAYYIVHRICLIRELKPILMDVSYEALTAAGSDLYLTHYLLQNGFDIRVRLLNSTSLFKSQNIAIMWLTCSYSQKGGARTPDLGWLCNAIEMASNPQMAVVACKLLIKLGGNVNRAVGKRFLVSANATPIILAIEENNLQLVRLLLYYNCDLKVRYSCFHFLQPVGLTEYAIRAQQFHIAKVLLQCGADAPDLLAGDIPLNARFDNKYEADRLAIIEMQRNPLSLQQLCRKTVREVMGPKLVEFLKGHAYPAFLKDYISTKHL